MKKQLSRLFRPFSLVVSLIAASLFVIGCSLIESPTATSDEA